MKAEALVDALAERLIEVEVETFDDALPKVEVERLGEKLFKEQSKAIVNTVPYKIAVKKLETLSDKLSEM